MKSIFILLWILLRLVNSVLPHQDCASFGKGPGPDSDQRSIVIALVGGGQPNPVEQVFAAPTGGSL